MRGGTAGGFFLCLVPSKPKVRSVTLDKVDLENLSNDITGRCRYTKEKI